MLIFSDISAAMNYSKKCLLLAMLTMSELCQAGRRARAMTGQTNNKALQTTKTKKPIFKKPNYYQDLYNHKENFNWKKPWDAYDDERYQHQAVDIHSKTVDDQIKSIFSDPDILLVDVRDNNEKEAFNFITQSKEIDLKARYMPFNYDQIKTNPYQFIKSVADATDRLDELESSLDEDALDLELESSSSRKNKNNEISLFTMSKPTNHLESLRDQRIVILCNYGFCGCRWVFATWHGFNNVMTIQNINNYLPGGEQDIFSSSDQQLQQITNENENEPGTHTFMESDDYLDENGDYDWDEIPTTQASAASEEEETIDPMDYVYIS